MSRVTRKSATLFLVAAGAPLALYLVTAAPGVTLVDSGELALVCRTLGIPHPPGFPLYVLLGHTFSWLPLGQGVARRMNLFSAICAALAAGFTFLLCRRLLAQPEFPPRKKPAAEPALSPDLAALAAALVFGFSLSLWSWAVVTEVYALNILILALMLWFAARADWTKAALAAGLALGVHHATIALALPAAFFLLWGLRRPARREWWAIAGLFVLGLSLYLYLPIRAASAPLFNWGNPGTPERFWWHVTAKQYRVHLFEAPIEQLAAHAAYFLELWFKQFSPLGFFLGGVGLLAILRRRRRLFWFTAILVLLNVGFAVNYDIGEDIEGYYLPTFLAWAWCLAYGAQAVVGWARRPWRKAVTGAVLASVLLPVAVHFPTNNRGRDRIAERYVENTLRGVEPGALVLTSDWQFYSPWLYRRHMENFRPDVAVVDTLMLRRSWYLEFLERQYPDLTRAAAPELEAYRKQLDLFEHDLPYNSVEIDGAFVALVERMARIRIDAGAHVYFTVKIERPFLPRLPVAPEGLVYKFGEASEPGKEVEMDLGGLNDGTAPLDRVEREVRQVYAVMLTARAGYLLRLGRLDEARSKAELALRLEPGYEPAQKLAASVPRP